MLPRRHRLQLRKERGFFHQAKRYSSPHFLVYFVKNDTLWQSAVLVSKKVSSKATQRNKIRRKVHSLLMTYLKKSPPCSLSAVIVVKPTTLQTDKQQLQIELFQVLQTLCENSLKK